MEYAAFKHQVIHQSSFNAHEVDDSDNEYTKIPSPCKHLQSVASAAHAHVHDLVKVVQHCLQVAYWMMNTGLPHSHKLQLCLPHLNCKDMH
jgi:hypothetical protein